MIIKSPLLILVLLVLAIALFLGAGCSGYNGPTISRVGVTGSYEDKEGEKYGGGIDADLAYPLPSPKPVDHSK